VVVPFFPFVFVAGLRPRALVAAAVGPQMQGVAQHHITGPSDTCLVELAALKAYRADSGLAAQPVCIGIFFAHRPESAQETGREFFSRSGQRAEDVVVGIPTENVVVRRCTMKDGHGGVTIGSEISGGCRNVFVEDCTMDSPNLDRAIRFKSNAVRGGVVENIFVRNVTVGTVGDAALQIDFVYEEGSNGPHKPVVRNLVIENMTVGNAKRVLDVQGFPGSEISGVRIHNSKFSGITGVDVVKEADVKLVNCVVEGKKK
jgi:hypothetical protein